MLRAGQVLILAVLSLLTLGVVMINSAGATVAADAASNDGTGSLAQLLTGRTALYALLAVAAMLFGSCVPIDRLYRARGLRSPIVWLLIAVVVCLGAVYAPGISRPVNGAYRWLNLGPLSFQPSELAKWGMVIILAAYVARHGSVMGAFRYGVLIPMVLVGFVCGLIAVEDLGSAALIAMVCAALLVAGGTRLIHAAMLAPPTALAVLAALFASPYRLDRLRAFIDPFQDPEGIGYHVIQSLSAVAGGGLAGRGLGHGIQKFGYLPEDTTDFIFAVICEELGIAGAVLVAALYAAIMLAGLAIVRSVTHPFKRLLGLGIILTIGLQALINMAVVTGLAPTKGIALPLISAGGTGWVLTSFSIGLLISMDRATLHPTDSSVEDETCDDELDIACV